MGSSQSLFHQVCVRSSFLCKGSWGEESQSLFHQVCVRSCPPLQKEDQNGEVAIPFSSGLCSFGRGDCGDVYCAAWSQSLFHQVCVRSRLDWQGFSVGPVAIPFSSGLCSFKRCGGETLRTFLVSQSLFHQVCVRSALVKRATRHDKGSQSLFHQVCVRSLATIVAKFNNL